ncbi:hypothetical protein G4Y79_14195 [Phototrophicus methaneseepsis]|uniref:Metalloenzyme domain-containing protein n=1 Tax=Phototrophicus methaneseepsis TaxID=2710758 RepID=A0A7S8E5V2_9CHLR|nr:hypothetical protein [Phototrophicus methaneseepsis]QPC80858.1 hypothetical protein G4Y79_14195 [Phototrophicus methaneseepsis]
MRILLLFLDGIGLGEDNSTTNPFAVADMPTLTQLTNGHRWLKGIGVQQNGVSSFIPTDPRLGVPGRPQSGTSQAVILTGENIPAQIGRHYGPKPNAETRAILAENNLFKMLRAAGKKTSLLDGYPPSLLKSIERGKTLPSSIQQAARESGQSLFTDEDVRQENALTAEYTGDEWHDHLHITDVPRYTPYEAGRQLVALARQYDFSMHSHWITDYVGHRGPFEYGVALLERFDGVMHGIVDHWDPQEGLVIITSDHGNMELIGDRHHTENDVPTLIYGARHQDFAEGYSDLTHITPRVLRLLTE